MKKWILVLSPIALCFLAILAYTQTMKDDSLLIAQRITIEDTVKAQENAADREAETFVRRHAAIERARTAVTPDEKMAATNELLDLAQGH